MLEYVFFNKEVKDKFVSYLAEKRVQYNAGAEDELIVEVSEDISREQGDAVDNFYESLLQEMAELMEEGDEALEQNIAGVQVQLSDGTVCTVRLDPDLVGRLLGCISMEEFRDLVQEISKWVELRDNSPLCHNVELKHD